MKQQFIEHQAGFNQQIKELKTGPNSENPKQNFQDNQRHQFSLTILFRRIICWRTVKRRRRL